MTLEKEIAAGESRTLEYKRELPEDTHKWIKTIVAFANGAGGKFVLGVNDKRQVVGLDASTDIFELKDGIADAIAQACEPQIMFDIYQESVGNQVVMVTEVFPGNSTPYHIKKLGVENGTFIRLGATTRQADENTLLELSLKRQHRYYDELPCTDINVTKKDMQLLCRNFASHSGKKITKDFLFNTGLLREESNILIASKAYSIFVGKPDFFCRIQCARFRGTDRVDFLDKKDFEGPLLDQVDGAFKFVQTYLRTVVKFEGLYRKESCELPEKALRELILNAVIHRNYMMSSCVQVAIYDDRVEISSPGALYGTLTLEEALSGRSSIRNKLLASVCEKLGIVEGWGTGLKRIIDQCKELKIQPPEFLEIGDLLRVNFYRNKENDSSPKVPQKFPESSPDIPQKVLIPKHCEHTFEELQKNPRITSEELSNILGISSRAIKKHFAELKKLGLIEYVGSQRDGYWLIKLN